MLKKIRLWISRNYKLIVSSIAFYPALIAIIFLLVSWIFISLDFSETGKHLKSTVKWLSLRDATTARSIISTIVAGILSLTVFSFSLVMIILNQTASQMSNRILDELIGNRFQQVILGTYIGTIVFALFLLSTIRDIDSGIYIPALSTYFLIVLTIIDIFLFIYFLHYITQSVKYEVIISRIYKETLESMTHCSSDDVLENLPEAPQTEYFVKNKTEGVFEGFNKKALLNFCEKNDCIIHSKKMRGDFLIKDSPVLQFSAPLSEEDLDDVSGTLYIHDSESIRNNFFYGFRQLTEVAVKALSPGINDPATAVQSLRALTKLFIYRIHHKPVNVIRDKNDTVRIITQERDIDEMFTTSYYPIWDYGKKDRIVLNELHRLLTLLLDHGYIHAAEKLQLKVSEAVQELSL